MSSYSRQQLEKWIKNITVVSGKVLDIGGSQNPIIKRLQNTAIQFNTSDYKILDLRNPHETKVKPDIIGDLNCSFLDYQDKYNTFDIAFCLEVSEYWWNPVQALRNINKFLKTGGVLCISFHFVYPVHNPKEQDYIRYTEFGVKKLLKETGFEIKNMQYRTSEGLEPMVLYLAEKMKPSKDYDKHNIVGFLVKAKKI